MPDAVVVLVHACDPISQAGMASQLRARPELRVVNEDEPGGAAVAVVVADGLDEETALAIKTLARDGACRVVAVLTNIDDAALFSVVEAGACGLLRRSEATPQEVAKVVLRAAAGDGTVPPDLLGRLLQQVGQLQRHVLAPRGFRISGLTQREIDVLKLVADGHNTGEIARELSYSERTIKNVIQDVITRFQLRNRSHAVAYALRQGLI
jgi:DNA-binding NarL/FixJ family response regulator